MLWAKLMQLLGRKDTFHALRICEEQGLIDEGYSREVMKGGLQWDIDVKVELALNE